SAGLPAARPAAGVRTQLLPRRLAPAPAYRRPVQPVVQHRHRRLAVPLPDRGAVRPARRGPGPAHRPAAALALALGQGLAPLPRRWRGTRRRPAATGGGWSHLPGAGAAATGRRGGVSGSVRVAVVMGVSGSGKTTLALALASAWEATFLDADDFHSDEARALM